MVHSEIYTTPRLAESLENAVSFGNSCISNANNIGNISNNNNFNTSTHNSSTLNNVHLQKHRIDALTTISTSHLTQTMDSIVDSKIRQGQY